MPSKAFVVRMQVHRNLALGQGLLMNRGVPGFPAWGNPAWGNRVARGAMINPRAYVGDPGLFSAIGKAISGVSKFVSKVVSSPVGKLAATTLLGPVGGGIATALSTVGAARIGAPASRSDITSMMPQPPAPTSDFSLPPLAFNDPGLGVSPGSGPGSPPTAQPEVNTASYGTSLALCNTKGYHMNKAGYWRNDNPALPGASWHPAGTVCVRNRRMNPFNPRAANRAMRRLASLHNGMKVLEKQLHKLAPKRLSRSSGKSCGCKGRAR